MAGRKRPLRVRKSKPSGLISIQSVTRCAKRYKWDYKKGGDLAILKACYPGSVPKLLKEHGGDPTKALNAVRDQLIEKKRKKSF